MEFILYQGTAPNRHGRFPGVFALANGLAAAGALDRADLAWHRTANAAANALYPDPTLATPDCYALPGARSWFKVSATHLLEMTQGYLRLLDKYGIGWIELRSTSPGTIMHEDEVQVVVVPVDTEEHRDGFRAPLHETR
ncbi:hypothetical protein GCM10009715_13940 [Paeniglutamicibacter psychrophenolicus]|uniref:Uncharacterized protein n=1 Tax=Paeniglutamicibacter psychrophenolicus TaxID=257454 RepID=A0ABS4WBQ8_9MICC|nr:hypothetical protein [Paeniglutamicibacter psychrophenolicus]MBP2373636.1 hypothetical protein [Paeniglutamicibacter psychrophenolicus]